MPELQNSRNVKFNINPKDFNIGGFSEACEYAFWIERPTVAGFIQFTFALQMPTGVGVAEARLSCKQCGLGCGLGHQSRRGTPKKSIKIVSVINALRN